MLYRSIYDIEWKYYDLLYGNFTEDIEFYKKIIKSGDVLELMCGTGRIANELSKITNVWCLDIDERMIEIASRKNSELNCIVSDVRNFYLAKKFDYIILPLNSILLFPSNEKKYILSTAAMHLKEDGKIIVDMIPPVDLEESVVYLGDHKVNGDTEIWRFFVPNYSEDMKILNLTYFYDIFEKSSFRRDSAILTLYLENMEDMRIIVKEAGLSINQVFGNYNMENYHPESSERLILMIGLK